MRELGLGCLSATGTVAKRTLPATREVDGLRVTALHGRDATRLGQLAGEYGVQAVHSDVQALIDDEAVDAVFVGSPPWLHELQISAAASSGKPCLCEKPIAQNLESALRIADVVNGALVRFAFHLRHAGWMRVVEELLDDRAIGDVRHVEAEWSFAMDGQARNAAWKLDPDRGGWGAMTDAGSHVLDAVLHLFGAPATVSAAAVVAGEHGTSEGVTGLFGYDGFSVTVHAYRDVAHPENALGITGTQGTIRVPSAFVEQPTSDVQVTVNGKTKLVAVDRVNPYAEELRDFVDTVDGSTRSRLATVADAVLVADVTEQMRRRSTAR